MSHSSLPPELLALPVSERVALVEQLWDSIAAEESSFELTATQRSELERRLKLRSEDPDRGSSWQEARERILGKS